MTLPKIRIWTGPDGFRKLTIDDVEFQATVQSVDVREEGGGLQIVTLEMATDDCSIEPKKKDESYKAYDGERSLFLNVLKGGENAGHVEGHLAD